MAEETTRRTRADRLGEIHAEAMERFDSIWLVVEPERKQALSDRRFAIIRGAQWEGQYAFGEVDDDGNPVDTGSPRMEVPKFYRPIRRVIGEYRNSRKTVDFRPKGADASRREANMLDGLYRADENDSPSGASAGYDNAFGEGIHGGFGAWRYRTRWEDESDEKNEHQRIGIEPVYDADQRVFFDLDAQNQDKSDARYAFLLTPMTREAFEAKYPKHDEATFAGKLSWQYDWVLGDTVTLAEYYVIEDKGVTRRTYRNLGTEEERTEDESRLTELRDDDTTLEDELLQTGWEFIRERKVKRQRVRKYLLSGAEVLKDEGYIAGPNIPIVPFYAERSYVDGIERSRGMVRPVIDPTRIYNVLVSNLTEAASGPSEDTPIVAPEQIQGLETIWADRKIKRPAYLPLRPIVNNDGEVVQSGPLGSIPVAPVSPNTAALIQVAGTDIMTLLGDEDRPQTVPSNTSAQAIELVQDEGDVADYLWRDNFGLAMQRGGAIWLGMASELYVEEGREMVSLDEEGKQTLVKLAEPATDEDGAQFRKNDLTTGRYDVVVDVGPATKTRRDATVRALLGIAQVATTAGQQSWAAGALGIALLNMDGEGIDGLRNAVRKDGLSAGWVEPNEEEAAAIKAANENAQPDPQQQLIQAAAMQAQAEAALAVSKTAETEAKAEQAKAKTAEILAGISSDQRKQAIEAARLLLEVGSQRFDQQMTMETGNGNAA